jgi:hypothetical protein
MAHGCRRQRVAPLTRRIIVVAPPVPTHYATLIALLFSLGFRILTALGNRASGSGFAESFAAAIGLP